MKIPSKLSRFLGNEKARAQLLSGVVVALLTLTAIAGIVLTKQTDALDATSIENFEDDTVGQNPSESWYTYSETGTATMEVSNTNESKWTKTFYFDPDPTSSTGHAYFNFTASTANNIVVDVYPVSGDNLKFYFEDASGAVGNGFRLNNPDFDVWNGSISQEGLTPVFQYENGQWYHVNFTLNFTTHECKLTVNSVNYGWYAFGNNIDNITCIEIQETGTTLSGTAYFDNITVYFASSGSNYLPSIDDTALQNSLTSGKLTWSGEAGDTVWCNSSGNGHETMNISIIDGAGADDADVTEIRIWVGDLAGSTYTITANNIELFASVDGATWHSFGTFPSGGENISLNSTTWSYTDNPFPISGNDTIYCRFKLSIPSDVAVDTYSASNWKIYLLG